MSRSWGGAGPEQYANFEWLLAVPFFTARVAIPNIDTGEAIEESVMHGVCAGFAKNFLTALTVVKLNSATAPVAFKANVEFGQGTPQVGPLEPAHGLLDGWLVGWRGELPGYLEHHYYGSGLFGDADLEPLSEVWRGLAGFRRLPSLADEQLSQEDFDLLYAAEGEDRRTSSRLGRALALFEDGIHLPPLHALLAMCLVLENLFTNDNASVTDKLATRVALTVGCGASYGQRAELYKEARKVYEARSRIVHGHELFNSQGEELRQSLELARRSLQCILRDRGLRRLFGPSDRRKGATDEDRLKGFFNTLSLGTTEDVQRFLASAEGDAN